MATDLPRPAKPGIVPGFPSQARIRLHRGYREDRAWCARYAETPQKTMFVFAGLKGVELAVR